jgi:6-phosphofructokinase 1
MGRHAGWLAASGVLAGINGEEIPEIILIPEVPFDQDKFLQKVEYSLLDDGFCAIIASEALTGADGKFISTSDFVDEFGNVQLGKVGIYLEKLIKNNLGKKVHVSLPDYLQRSSRHIASFVDWQEASQVGTVAVIYSTVYGMTDKMVAIVRDNNDPYISHFEPVELEGIAGETKIMPSEFIGKDNMSVSEKFIEYVRPLIKGEAPNLFLNGIPTYPKLKLKNISKKEI